jgi:hypothetical protein
LKVVLVSQKEEFSMTGGGMFNSYERTRHLERIPSAPTRISMRDSMSTFAHFYFYPTMVYVSYGFAGFVK